ncbi:hypothetical protein ASE40_06710 [Flavobacterium sp. Root935]|nr:hypothetical protein ASE40_06710 [Flavobacterium sp. Root935]
MQTRYWRVIGFVFFCFKFQVSGFKFQVSGFLCFEYNFTAKHAKFFNKPGFAKTQKFAKL